ncbi:uncharacterized protein LOC115764801 [Drosophila novamexicana]|uniref:uncharacterized protein LOC115764801 n=1 Tax=Drosophila novamexicana TaxID=47314 RepID=UPI0011E5E30E|nr:uncharacterized protein LOC115764801 [Drosophila novamexicana]
MDTDADSNQRENGPSLDSSFFETLWPLILDDNKCRVESESVDFFVPRKPFDQLRWHTLLANVGFPDYEKPHDLRCCEAAKQQEESEQMAEKAVDEAVERQSAVAADYEPTGSRAIRRVDKEVEFLQKQQHRRQHLAYCFANRKYPRAMQTPIHEVTFVLTRELRAGFQCPMEHEILEGIYQYNCKLILIDASTDVCVDDFQRWIKFRPYAQMLCLVRCPRVERHLQLLKVFHTLLVEEDAQNSWHEELECSIRAGLKEAKRLELFPNCADAFVFVFSRYRSLCTCDTYKILRRI